MPRCASPLWTMKNPALLSALLLLTMLSMFMVNLFFGSIHLDFGEVLLSLLGRNEDSVTRFVVIESRLPQAITALLCGAGLAVSGLLLQTVFHNPLADPSILGVNSGASLGVAFVMLVLGGSLAAEGSTIGGFLLIVAAAFSGAICIIMLLLLFSRYVKGNTTLLIAGIMVSYLTSSVISLLNYSATEQGVHSYIIWGLGNFGGIGLKNMPMFAGALLLCIGLTITLIKPLNALQLGSSYARNLGVNIRRTRSMLLVVTGFIAAITTAFCGPISFIGLAVPHIVRLICRTANHRVLVPLTLLTGAIVGLFCNWLCTLPADGTTIPINVVTPFFGVPVIVYVLLPKRGLD